MASTIRDRQLSNESSDARRCCRSLPNWTRRWLGLRPATRHTIGDEKSPLLGHYGRLMPPQFVKPYVKSQKNDAADASAIAEAVQRPTMRFVPIKSADQQAVLMLHRTRDLLIRQRSSLISALRAHFAEFGIVVGQGIRNVERLLALLETHGNRYNPALAFATI